LLQDIPPELGDCKKLVLCYLQENQITKIPESILHIPTLCLDGNYLSPPLMKIFEKPIVQLTSLDLSEMGLEAIPAEIIFLERLQVLNLAQNRLSEITVSLVPLKQLEQINVSNNNLSHLPEWFASLPALRNLILDNNSFSAIPEATFGIKTLYTLSVRSCKLQTLPNQATAWDLAILDCSENQISSLSDLFISSLHHLEELHCTGNSIRVFPHSLFMLKSLEALHAANNSLEYLSDDKSDTDIACRFLHTVDITNNSLLDLPLWLFEKTKIKDLQWAGNCNLPEYYSLLIPYVLNRKPNDLSLEITFQRLTKVPPVIQVLGRRIRKLDLCGNSLSQFPEIISEFCTELQYLDLSRNQLSTLPSSCRKLRNLVDFLLSQNRFVIFPEILFSLRKLKRVFLSFNHIEALPDLNQFYDLHELHITNNQITQLPSFPKESFVFNYRFNPVHLDQTQSPLLSPLIPEEQEHAPISPTHQDFLESSLSPKMKRRGKGIGGILSPMRESEKKKKLSNSIRKAFGSKNRGETDQSPPSVHALSQPVSIPARRNLRNSSSNDSSGIDASPKSSSQPWRSTAEVSVSPKNHTWKAAPSTSPKRSDSTSPTRLELLGSRGRTKSAIKASSIPIESDISEPANSRSSEAPPHSTQNSGSVRVFLRLHDGPTKPARINPSITLEELKELITGRLNLKSEIQTLSVTNGNIEWNIEENDDVAELLANDVITIFTV